MHDGVVVELALIAYRREDVALQHRGFVEDHQRLVRIACQDQLVERLFDGTRDSGRLVRFTRVEGGGAPGGRMRGIGRLSGRNRRLRPCLAAAGE